MVCYLKACVLSFSLFLSLSPSSPPSLPTHLSHPLPSSVDEDDSVLVPRHLLIFLNPASGSGKTISDFKQHIQPLFDLAEIHYHLIVTGTYVYFNILLCSFNVMCILECLG